MLWAAGKNRYVYADSRIGIHSATAINNITGESRENPFSYTITMIMARAYLNLRVPVYLIGAMVITPPESTYWLNDYDKLTGMTAYLLH